MVEYGFSSDNSVRSRGDWRRSITVGTQCSAGERADTVVSVLDRSAVRLFFTRSCLLCDRLCRSVERGLSATGREMRLPCSRMAPRAPSATHCAGNVSDRVRPNASNA